MSGLLYCSGCGRLAEAEKRVVVLDNEPLNEREIREALCVEIDNRLWVAIHQLLETEIESVTSEAVDPDTIQEGMAPYYNGGLAHLRRFQDFLWEHHRDAQKVREEFEEG